MLLVTENGEINITEGLEERFELSKAYQDSPLQVIRSFLEEYDFSGKTVIPFCTTLGAGIGESEDNVKAHANGAEVLKGVALRTGRQNMSEDISKWLSDIGMAK